MYIRFRFLICFVVMAVAITSCSNQNDSMTNHNQPDAITFVSGLNNFSTRVSQDGSRWTAGDKVGIYMIKSGETTATDYSNVPYEAESSAQTTAFKAGEASLYYPADGTAVSFVAYHPYSSTITNMVYPVRLADQSAGSVAHDLLYAKADNGGSGLTEGSISFGFTHQLSKIILNLVDESGNVITPDTGGIALKGMNTTANFDLKTAALSDAGTVEDITPYHHSNSFEAILLPFTIGSGHEVTIVVNGNQYKWTMSNSYSGMEIKTGYSYTFKITVKTSAAEVDAVLVRFDGNSIAPWEDGGDDNQTEVPTEDIEIPADFEIITLSSGGSIKSALSGATGSKVAIVLANGGSYSESSGFSIPASITSLMIVGEGGMTTPSVYIASSMAASGNMDLIQLYNVELSGIAGSSYFINQGVGVNIKEFIVENAIIHNVRGIVRMHTSVSTIELYKITRSVIYNIGGYNLLTIEGTGSVSSIELTKSTVYNLCSRGFYLNGASTTVTPVATIDQCTFNLGPYYAVVQFNATAGGSLTFTNNIFGLPFDISDTSLGTTQSNERGVSARSGGTTVSESNNFYVSNTTWSGTPVGTNCGFTSGELFADPANGNFTQSKLTAGDPRWY